VGFCQKPSVHDTPTSTSRRALRLKYCRSCRSDARDATSHVGRNWIQMGHLPHHKWKSYRTISVWGKTWCVCLPAYISKYCVRPLYKFMYALQVVKWPLKHSVYTEVSGYVINMKGNVYGVKMVCMYTHTDTLSLSVLILILLLIVTPFRVPVCPSIVL
jgi:hypothetical protein